MKKPKLRTRLSIISFIVLGLIACKCEDGTKSLSGCSTSCTNTGGPSKDACSNLSTITIGGVIYRDLNNNGTLEDYENILLTVEQRIEDLLIRMTLEDKVGAMLLTVIPVNNDGIDYTKLETLIKNNRITHFVSPINANAKTLAETHNKVQAIAGINHFGIPLTIASFPRNTYLPSNDLLTVQGKGQFSQWPGTLGLAALALDGKKNEVGRTNDTELVKKFGDIVRQEYRAVGIHMSFSPQGDLATEPRWSGIHGTFGEEYVVVQELAAAYIEGFQNGTSGLTDQSVAAVLRNYPGAGAQTNGLDAMNAFGKTQSYPYSNFTRHLDPYQYIIKDKKIKVASVMASAGVPINAFYLARATPVPDVAFSFNSFVLKDILRTNLGYDGVVISSWGVVADCDGVCATGLTPAQVAAGELAYQYPFGTPWEMERETPKTRIIKAINSGVDQLAGWEDPAPIIEAINEGSIAIATIDDSVRRILTQKLRLGIFNNSCVIAEDANKVVGKTEFVLLAQKAQRESQVLLKNSGNILPFSNLRALNVYLHNFSSDTGTIHGLNVVTNLDNADIVIMRAETPHEITKQFAFGNNHFGSVEFTKSPKLTDIQITDSAGNLTTVGKGEYIGSADFELMLQASNKDIPIILSLYMPRPTAIANLTGFDPNGVNVDVIIANFGAEDDAVIDVITGAVKAKGKLPFDLPYDESSLLVQGSDAPFDVMAIIDYAYGSGLTY